MMNNIEYQQKSKWQEFKEAWKDPVKKKVRTQKFFITVGSLLRGFILIGLCFVILLPIFEKLSAALRHPTDISNPQIVFIPATFSVINFQVAAEMLTYTESLLNTAVLSTFTTIIQVVSTAVAGYAFAKLKFKGSNVIFLIVICTLVVPNEALDRSRTWILQEYSFFGLNLIGNVFSMYIMAAFGQGIRSAIFIFLFRQFFKGVPKELEESAEVDGAGVIRTFWSVMLPNARGAIVTVALFAFVWQYNDLYWAELYKVHDANVLPLLTTSLQSGAESFNAFISTFFQSLIASLGESIGSNSRFYGLILNTAALLMMLPLIVGYLFVQRLFVESIERTGITGM